MLATMTNVNPTQPTPGWYDDGSGRQRWWDGYAWQMYAPDAPAAPHHTAGPMNASQLNVRRDVQYTRQQTGHSLTKLLMIDWLTLYIRTIYYAASPNHYFHA